MKLFSWWRLLIERHNLRKEIAHLKNVHSSLSECQRQHVTAEQEQLISNAEAELLKKAVTKYGVNGWSNRQSYYDNISNAYVCAEWNFRKFKSQWQEKEAYWRVQTTDSLIKLRRYYLESKAKRRALHGQVLSLEAKLAKAESRLAAARDLLDDFGMIDDLEIKIAIRKERNDLPK